MVRSSVELDVVDANGSLDVLEWLLSHIFEGEVEPGPNLITNGAGHRDSAWRGDSFEPCRHVHSIAKDIAVLDDAVAEMDTNPEFDPAIPRDGLVPLAHAALDFGRAGDGIHHTRELRQHAVPCELDNAALVLGDPELDQFGLMRLETGERAGLVRANEAAVAHNVGGKNGDQATFHMIPRTISLRVNHRTYSFPDDPSPKEMSYTGQGDPAGPCDDRLLPLIV